MGGSYWDRFGFASLKNFWSWDNIAPQPVQDYAMRVGEETGLRDIWDELARFGDDGMSVAETLSIIPSAAWQGLTAFPQTATALGTEANRFAGAAELAGPSGGNFWDPSSYGKQREGFTLQPFKNYLTGGLTDEQRKDLYSRSAPGVYNPLTLGKLMVVTSDRELNEGMNDFQRWTSTLGVGFQANGAGTMPHGSFLPAAWDVRAPDAGAQLDDFGVLRSQIGAADLASELLLNPLNFANGPVGAAVKGSKGFRLVTDSAGADTLLGGAGEAARTGLLDADGTVLSGALELSKINRRIFNIGSGFGLLNQGRMIQTLQSEKFNPIIDRMVASRDVDDLTRLWQTDGMAIGDAARSLAQVTAQLNSREQVLHLFNAAAYRNVESVGVIDAKLASEVAMNSEFKTLLQIQDDVFQKALVDFVPGELIPDGHILKETAQKFVQEALETNPTVKSAYEALAPEGQAAAESLVQGRLYAMEAQQKLFGGQSKIAPRVGARSVVDDVSPVIDWLPRARRFDLEPGSWLNTRTKMLPMVNGPVLSRFRPKIILMDKPGLTFNLHADDAIDKFNDIIRWADGYIGTGGRGVSTLAHDYRFGTDPELVAIHQQFLDAGVTAVNPEMIRAGLINDLQSLVLRKIAQANGIEEASGMILATHGMERGEQLANALNDSQYGYTTAIREDEGFNVLAWNGAVERQAPNFVPLMDWEAAGRAMRAIGHSRPATAPNSLVSEATVRTLVEEGGQYANRPLKYVGSEQPGIGSVRRAGHSIIDMADAASYIFKANVLLRLGYTTRNLSEGALSAYAAGVPLLDVMKSMDIRHLVTDRLYNMKNLPTRMVDRFATHQGLWLNEEASLRFAEAKAMEVNRTSERAEQMAAIAASRERTEELVDIAMNVDGKYTPHQAAQAMADITDQVALEQRLNLAITTRNTEQMGPFRPASSAHAAQHLYHADTAGTMSAGHVWDSEGMLTIDQALDRPIRLTDSPVLAHAHVDKQWTQVPITGKVQAHREPHLEAQRTATGATHYGFTSKAGKQQRTTKASVVLAKADETQPITLHAGLRGAPMGTVTMPPHTGAVVGRAYAKTHHVQMRDNPTAAWAPYREAGLLPTSEVRVLDKAKYPDGFPKAVSVDTWGAEVDLRTSQDVQRLTDEYFDLDMPLVDAARAGDQAAVDRLSEVLAEKGIYRMVIPDSRANGWHRYQIVVHPKGLGNEGYKNAVQAHLDEIIDEGVRIRGLKAPEGGLGIIRKKRRGDRPDDILSVNGLTRKQVKEINRHVLDPAHREAANAALIGTPLEPLQYMESVDVLRNGGFAGLVDEVVNASITARADLNMVHGIYQQRAARMQAIAKRKGLGQHALANMFTVASSYGNAPRVLPSLLNGTDGGVYGARADSSATHLAGMMSEGYAADGLNDIRRSMMTPKTLAPTDPRYFDALANLFNRQFRDGFAAGQGLDNLDPVVRRLVSSGDRQRVVTETIDWALNTVEGQQWVRTLGLKVAEGRTVPAELQAAEAAAKRRMPATPATTAAERREVQRVNWRGGVKNESITVGEVELGDVVSTMSNFVENWILPSRFMTEQLANGEVITGDLLRAAHAVDPWELHPVSGLLSPTTAESRAMLKARRDTMHGMDKVNSQITGWLSKGLQTLGAAPETRMLRHPVFEAVGQADMRQRIAAAERMYGRDLSLAEIEQIRSKSQKFALKTVERTLYTLSGRSMLDDWLRFVVPFFPAWRNAVTRWGKFAMENPARVGLIPGRAGAVQGNFLNIVNEDGEPVEWEEGKEDSSYVVLPGFGGVAKMLSGLPGVKEMMEKTLISTRSLDVIFQGDIRNPGFGPFVTAPMQWVMTRYPEWNEGVMKRITDYAFPVGPVHSGGGAGQDFGLAFLSTGIRRFVEASTSGRAYAAEMTKAQYLLEEQYRTGEYTPVNAEQVVEDAGNIARWKLWVKVLSAFVSPFASQQRGEVEQYAGFYRTLREAYGSTDLADEQFRKLFPDQYILTLSSSKNPTGGTATSRTVRNQKALAAAERLAESKDDPTLMAWPLNYDDTTMSSHTYGDDEYNPFAVIWQERNRPAGSDAPYRSKYTPEQAIREAQIKDGWATQREARAATGADLAAQGLAPGSYEFDKQMQGRMAVSSDILASQNEAWGNDRRKRDEGRLVRNENFFKQLLTDESNGFINDERRSHAGIQSMILYLAARDETRNNIWAMNRAGIDIRSSNAVAGIKLAENLQLFRTKLEQGSPEFADWANRWFANDFVTIENTPEIFQGGGP